MYTIDFKNPIHVHFIGIGGISMSGLAEVLLEEGFRISGSDARESELTRRLASRGATVLYGQRAENISDDTDLVVYTAAIHPDNPEYAAAAEKGIPMLTRADLLGQMMKNYRLPIAVAGTHGKTTHHFHGGGSPPGSGPGSHHFRGRHPSLHRREYPGGPFGYLPDRGL